MFAIFVVIVEMILSHRSRRESNLRKIPSGLRLTGVFLYWNQGAGLFGYKGIESLGFRGHLALDFAVAVIFKSFIFSWFTSIVFGKLLYCRFLSVFCLFSGVSLLRFGCSPSFFASETGFHSSVFLVFSSFLRRGFSSLGMKYPSSSSSKSPYSRMIFMR